MDTLLSNLLEYWLSFVIIFLLVFTAISYIFVKEKVAEMYLGILRVLISIFYSPLIFLKKSILNLVAFGKKGEKENLHSKQFLLQKIIIFLETILIVISISFIVSGIIVGWNSFLPPLQLREARSNTEVNLDNAKDEMETVAPVYEQMKNFWDTKKDSLINAHVGQNKAELQKLQDTNNNLSKKLAMTQKQMRYLITLKII